MTRESRTAEKPAGRTMHLNLRAGERVYINGAVVRADRKVSLELMNDATFLLEGHVLQVEEATTPLRQLYFAAQTMLIEPAQAGPARALYGGLEEGILAVTTEPAILAGLRAAQALVAAGRPFEALKIIRGLFPVEAALIDGAVPAPAPAEAPVPAVRLTPRRQPANRPLRAAPSLDKARPIP
ncbi:flagellar biosynthesis repressor FlbT [Methylobacterium sp. Leaf118]|uniref:flagellar biosynthesis repressor FlbT n=1 Tax=Methylobacterium sp. Leaf118 TaxID=2876562 RepID=UPI001E62B7F3|nr:flagellar biosynthesis repressor FlbT [Methylobacterium sp. Leaf118]